MEDASRKDLNVNVTNTAGALKVKTRTELPKPLTPVGRVYSGTDIRYARLDGNRSYTAYPTYNTPMPTACPICKRSVDAPPDDRHAPTANYYPFCSERCKLIDLGRWLDGKYQVPVVEDDLDEAAGADEN